MPIVGQIALSNKTFARAAGTDFSFTTFRQIGNFNRIVTYASVVANLPGLYQTLFQINDSLRTPRADGTYTMDVSINGQNYTVVIRVAKGEAARKEDISEDVTRETLTPKRLSALIAHGALTALGGAADYAPFFTITNALVDSFLKKEDWRAKEDADKKLFLTLYLAYVSGYEMLACTVPHACAMVIQLKMKSPDATGTTKGVIEANKRGGNENTESFAMGRAPIKAVEGENKDFAQWLVDNENDVSGHLQFVTTNFSGLRSGINQNSRRAAVMRNVFGKY